VIVRDLNVIGASIAPYKTKAPLIVDSNAVLSLPVAAKNLQSVTGRRSRITQFRSAIQLPQFAARNLLNHSKSPAQKTLVKARGLGASERLNHILTLFCIAFNVNQ
jgi:hypothetical protein